MNIDKIKQLFSRTIFWNYLDEWPGDRHKDPDSELAIYEGEIDPDGSRNVFLIFESGEASVSVAVMQPATKEQDAESHTTDDDVEFISQLPVMMPVLLTIADKLESTRVQINEAVIELDAALTNGKFENPRTIVREMRNTLLGILRESDSAVAHRV